MTGPQQAYYACVYMFSLVKPLTWRWGYAEGQKKQQLIHFIQESVFKTYSKKIWVRFSTQILKLRLRYVADNPKYFMNAAYLDR